MNQQCSILFSDSLFEILMIIYEIRKKVTRSIIIIDRFFRFIYNLAKEARRNNVKIQKLAEKKSKSNELLFYKSFMKKNLSK